MSGAATQWPAALTPELREILGFMCFHLGPVAHAYRAAGEFVGADGEPLRSRAEDEQAFMLHKLVGFWVDHGPDWRSAFAADIERLANLDQRAHPDRRQSAVDGASPASPFAGGASVDHEARG